MMRAKQIAKIITDILMTIILLLLMAYSMVGEAAHEWLGIGMFVLFILHHVLNSSWSRNLCKGRYTPFRILQTALVVLVLISMIGSMISGIVLSRHALAFLPITSGQSWARTLHMISAYWGFVLMSLHRGLHWNILLAMAGKIVKKPSVPRTWVLRIAGCLIAAYGAYAFAQRGVGRYMTLQDQFVFFDFSELLILFLLDYVATMGLFVFIGYYLAKALMHFNTRTLP